MKIPEAIWNPNNVEYHGEDYRDFVGAILNGFSTIAVSSDIKDHELAFCCGAWNSLVDLLNGLSELGAWGTKGSVDQFKDVAEFAEALSQDGAFKEMLSSTWNSLEELHGVYKDEFDEYSFDQYKCSYAVGYDAVFVASFFIGAGEVSAIVKTEGIGAKIATAAKIVAKIPKTAVKDVKSVIFAVYKLPSKGVQVTEKAWNSCRELCKKSKDLKKLIGEKLGSKYEDYKKTLEKFVSHSRTFGKHTEQWLSDLPIDIKKEVSDILNEFDDTFLNLLEKDLSAGEHGKQLAELLKKTDGLEIWKALKERPEYAFELAKESDEFAAWGKYNFFKTVTENGNKFASRIVNIFRKKTLPESFYKALGIPKTEWTKYQVFTEVPLVVNAEGGFMKADIVLVKFVGDDIKDVIVIENKLSKGTAYTVRQTEGFGTILKNGKVEMEIKYDVNLLKKGKKLSVESSKIFKIHDTGDPNGQIFVEKIVSVKK